MTQGCRNTIKGYGFFSLNEFGFHVVKTIAPEDQNMAILKYRTLRQARGRRPDEEIG